MTDQVAVDTANAHIPDMLIHVTSPSDIINISLHFSRYPLFLIVEKFANDNDNNNNN